MTKLMTTLTISTIASIMIIAGFIAAPDAYSTKNNDEPDECKCEKPDTLKVKFDAPVSGDFKIEIYKKFEDRNDPKTLPLWTFDNVPQYVTEDDPLVVSAILFGKDKLESNTAFVVYKVDVDSVGNITEEVVAEMEIHTSCSKPLFVGKTVTDNQYIIEVLEGTKGGTPSIPTDEPLSCEDKKSKRTGTITIRKAITNDNGRTATPADFTISVMNIETNISYQLIQNADYPSINEKDIPTGTYKINETGPEGYTTVLIAGDTNCPAMVDEVFTIKKGKTISCTIYNDDDFTDVNTQAVVDAQAEADAAQAADQAAADAQAEADAAQAAADAVIPSDPDLDQAAADAQAEADAVQVEADSTDALELQIIADDAQAEADSNIEGNEGIPGGIVFQNNSLQVQLNANILKDSCDQYTIEEKNITPCIEIINKNSGDIAIVDSSLVSATTIILFSVAQEEQLDSDTGALNPNCKQFTIIRHDKQVFTLQDDDLSFPTIPTEHLVVVLQCANMDPSKVYNVNYVMIDPTM